MKVTVLGARGMLGHDVLLAAENEGHEVRGYGHGEVDITDPDQVARRLRLDRPDAVVNCAAWTDVDGAEDEPDGALVVNGTGAGIVADSVPESEQAECVNKAKALFRAAEEAVRFASSAGRGQ